MALCRCLQIHEWPRGKTTEYVGYAKPVGYPNTFSICGRPDCGNPGVIWLDNIEKTAYQNGQKIFGGPNNFNKMKADDSGFNE